jgi:lipoyl(octanoyl) transferase
VPVGVAQSPPVVHRGRSAAGGYAGDVTLQILDDWYGAGAIDYLDAWELQRELHAQRVADEITDTALFLEHPPVYTAGRRTEPHERPVDGTPVVDVDRGGKITFHGPGQLVGYPITKLPSHVLVVDYVRRVEEALIRACADLGVPTGRVSGRSGVWLAAGGGRIERKIGAIGIRVSRGVTMHGFSLNADVDLGFYDRFVPCGIADAGVTTLSAELGRDVTVTEAAAAVTPHLRELLDWQPYQPSPDLAHDEDLRVPVLGLGAGAQA